MKKNFKAAEVTRLNRAAFRVGLAELGGDAADQRLELALARVLGGTSAPPTCTTFTCNMYAPVPSP